MSYADQVFIHMCRDIIDNGTSTEGEKVRPVWEDGTPAYTVKKFGVVNRYDLSKEFPALRAARTSFCGSGRENPTISTISTPTSGTAGLTRTGLSGKPTAIRCR